MKKYIYGMRTKDGIMTGTCQSIRTGEDLYESAKRILTEGGKCVCFLMMAANRECILKENEEKI